MEDQIANFTLSVVSHLRERERERSTREASTPERELGIRVHDDRRNPAGLLGRICFVALIMGLTSRHPRDSHACFPLIFLD